MNEFTTLFPKDETTASNRSHDKDIMDGIAHIIQKGNGCFSGTIIYGNGRPIYIQEEKMKKINLRIQRNNNLNEVYVDDVEGPGGGRHHYQVARGDLVVADIQFQNGPRSDEKSTPGVLEGDLLEIVRSRLQYFQKGEYATRENACALTHIEEALMWIAKRADDRAEQGKLGTMKK